MKNNNLPQSNFNNQLVCHQPPLSGGLRKFPPDKGGKGGLLGSKINLKFSRCAVRLNLTLAIILILLLSGCGIKNKNINIKKAEIKINSTIITAEVVKTLEAQIKGLSGREKLGENEGMLFIYSEKEIRTFWMKDMLFPIDIIWISDDKIVDISENMPIPKNYNIKRATPKEEINYVLEVNAGFVKSDNFKVGDSVQIILSK